MAESVTFSEERHSSIQKVAITVVSASDGTADGTSTYAYSGELVRFVAVPDSGGHGGLLSHQAFDVTIFLQ